MTGKRFIQLGDTHIKDTVTGEEWYAPCETTLMDLLNEQQELIEEQDRLVEKLRWVIDVKQKYIEKIEKENDDLDKIPPKIREVWLDD